MAKTFAQLTKEIEALTSKAEMTRKKEMAGVVARIKAAVKAYGLTAGDLGLSESTGRTASAVSPAKLAETTKTVKRAPRSAKGAGKSRKRKSSIRFRDSAGHAWTGMGPKPAWLKDALAGGTTLESLMVSNGEGAEAAPKSAKTKARASRSSSPSPKSTSPKFKDASGNSWSGRGPRPRWFKAALAGGTSPDDLLA